MSKKALLLSGGAPNATLMAGALHSFLERGIEFDVISTSGAGAMVGLLYAAPKDQTPQEALENTKNYGIDDLIYAVLPVNYKVFHKSSPYADMYNKMASMWLQSNPFYNPSPQTRTERFLTDWQELLVAMFAPSNLSALSQGTAANVPFIEDVVDFEALQKIDPMFYVNAYNIDRREMVNFYNRGADDKMVITGDHFRASMAYPFIYPPMELHGEFYYEGATHDSLNYKALFNADDDKALHPEIDTIVVLDILGNDHLIRTPRSLWDAFNISIIAPLTELTRDDTKIFELKYNKNPDGSDKRKLLKVPFDIPADAWETALDWSYSNLSHLYDIGRQAGDEFCEANAADLA